MSARSRASPIVTLSMWPDQIDTVATVTALYEGLQAGSELLVTARARNGRPVGD